jgi:hypothetical protein
MRARLISDLTKIITVCILVVEVSPNWPTGKAADLYKGSAQTREQ